MKFGKLLKDLTEGNPQMSEQPLIRYKELKKHLKSIKNQQNAAQQVNQSESAATAQAAAAAAAHSLQMQEEMDEEQETAAAIPGQDNMPQNLSAEEKAFINMLNEDLLRFNRFFMDKEEEAVIKLQALADRIEAAKTQPAETQELKASLVDFHGEMVLLLHWSLLNYAAVVKILKKHDKQSGLLLRAPYLANVLQQPFYSTSIMSRLVKMAEGHIESLVAQETQQEADAEAAAATTLEDAAADSSCVVNAPASQAAAAAGPGSHKDREQACDGIMQPSTAAAAGGNELDTDSDAEAALLEGTAVCARTRVALQTWQQLCYNASTPSTVLPSNSSQALVRALHVRQRWAKLVSMAPIMQQFGMDGATPCDDAERVRQPAAEHTGDPAAVASQQQHEQQQAAVDDVVASGLKHKVEDVEEETETVKRQRVNS